VGRKKREVHHRFSKAGVPPGRRRVAEVLTVVQQNLPKPFRGHLRKRTRGEGAGTHKKKKSK